MIDTTLFVHSYENTAFAKLDWISFKKQVAFDYNEYQQLLLQPDLLGKTVKVSEFQFKELHEMAKRLAAFLDMPVPDIYIYENFYYTCESKGLDNNWIEMSAKTLTELNKGEVMFLLAKEMCAIKLRHTYHYTLIDEFLKVPDKLPLLGVIPGVNAVKGTMQTIGEVKFYQWMRVSHYTSDSFAYLICGDITTCVSAIIKTVLNSTFLAGHVNVMEFIRQAEKINGLNSRVHTFSKMDEQVPYAPYRIKNLIGFAASERGLHALRILNQEGGI
jgi:hypothetical protein